MNPLELLANPSGLFMPILTDLITPESIRIIISLIMFGYMIKMIPRIDNRLIPGINCFLLGPAQSFLLLGWPLNSDINPLCRWPEIASYYFAYQRGFLLGVLSWLLYGIVIETIENWITKIKGRKHEIPATITTPSLAERVLQSGPTPNS